MFGSARATHAFGPTQVIVDGVGVFSATNGCDPDLGLTQRRPFLFDYTIDVIGAYAIGSHEGYIYVRDEYKLAVTNFSIALKQARELGVLGRNILGSGFDFDITVSRGGGAILF